MSIERCPNCEKIIDTDKEEMITLDSGSQVCQTCSDEIDKVTNENTKIT